MRYQNPTPELPGDGGGGLGKKTQYESPEGYTMYDSVFFAFIDVLGFRQAFDENRMDNNKQFARDYEDVFSRFNYLLAHASFIRQNSSNLAKAGQTSDSLYFYTDRPDYLSQFIKIYLYFSRYAMSRNIFFRGGIAEGCLFINEPYQFYGDCVIKAYLLEENISKFPRIALDKKTYDVLKDISDFSSAFDSEEGRYFLKPFFQVTCNELASLTDLGTSDILQILDINMAAVSKHIYDGKMRFEFDEKTYLKYHFLEKQFNQSSDLA